MCGLCGFSGAPFDPKTGKGGVDITKMNTLLYFNKSRGTDSTGIYSNKKVIKQAVSADKFVIENKEYKEALKESNLVIAHTRWATIGDVTDDNAHPFVSGTGRGTIYGTHNGWLIDTMLEDIADKYDVEIPAVDSKIIFDILAKTKDINVIKELPGAMALAFVKNNKLNLYRRTSRPLYYGIAPEGLYYSSLSYPLKLIGCIGVSYLPRDSVFTIVDGNLEDSVKIGIPTYIPSLPENASQLSWRWSIPQDETSKIPFQSKKYRSDHTKTTNVKKINGVGRNMTTGETSTRKTGMENGAALGGGFKNLRAPKDVVQAQSDFMHTIRDKKELLAAFTNLDYLDLEDAGDFGLIVIKMVNNQTKEPTINMPLFVAEYPELATKTNDLGYAAVRIPLDVPHEQIRMMTLDPLTERAFYSQRITAQRKRVVEVTLSVPFRSKEEAKKIDEGDIDWLLRLRTTDIQSTSCFVPTFEQRKAVFKLNGEDIHRDGQRYTNTNKEGKEHDTDDIKIIGGVTYPYSEAHGDQKIKVNGVHMILDYEGNLKPIEGDYPDEYDACDIYNSSPNGDDIIYGDHIIWKEEGFDNRAEWLESKRIAWELDDVRAQKMREEKLMRQSNPVVADEMKKKLDEQTMSLVCAYKPDGREYTSQSAIDQPLLKNFKKQLSHIDVLNKTIGRALDIDTDEGDMRMALSACLGYITGLAYDLEVAMKEIEDSPYLIPF